MVSYLFIAIIWINHHHLMRFVGAPTLGLIWINFVHLFLVSLLPLATAWIARTRLASSPMVFYAGVFVCIDIACNVFEHQVFAGAEAGQVSPGLQRIARGRSLVLHSRNARRSHRTPHRLQPHLRRRDSAPAPRRAPRRKSMMMSRVDY